MLTAILFLTPLLATAALADLDLVNNLARRQSGSGSRACLNLVQNACPGSGCLDAACSSICTSSIPGLSQCCQNRNDITVFEQCLYNLGGPGGDGPTLTNAPSSSRSGPYSVGTIASISDTVSSALPGRYTSVAPGGSTVVATRPTSAMTSRPTLTGSMAPSIPSQTGSAQPSTVTVTSNRPPASTASAAAGVRNSGNGRSALLAPVAALVVGVLL